jgi:hypothetical protein
MKRPGKPMKPVEPKEPSKFSEWEFSMTVFDGEFKINEAMDIFLKELTRGRYIHFNEEVGVFMVENSDRLYLKHEYDGYDDSHIELKFPIKAEDGLIENQHYDTQMERYHNKLLDYPAKLSEYERKLANWEKDDITFVENTRKRKEAQIAKLQKEIRELG